MDGEFYLRVKSRILQVCCTPFEKPEFSAASHLLCGRAQIYCADMHTDFPKEYLTLRSGQMDNYSEVYGHRCECVCVRREPRGGYL